MLFFLVNIRNTHTQCILQRETTLSLLLLLLVLLYFIVVVVILIRLVVMSVKFVYETADQHLFPFWDAILYKWVTIKFSLHHFTYFISDFNLPGNRFANDQNKHTSQSHVKCFVYISTILLLFFRIRRLLFSTFYVKHSQHMHTSII